MLDSPFGMLVIWKTAVYSSRHDWPALMSRPGRLYLWGTLLSFLPSSGTLTSILTFVYENPAYQLSQSFPVNVGYFQRSKQTLYVRRQYRLYICPRLGPVVHDV